MTPQEAREKALEHVLKYRMSSNLTADQVADEAQKFAAFILGAETKDEHGIGYDTNGRPVYE